LISLAYWFEMAWSMTEHISSDMYLGIDIGTSKTAAVITDGNGEVHAVAGRLHRADIPSPPGRSEQDVSILFESCWNSLKRIPQDLRRRISGIGVTGQMHGVVLLDRYNAPVSPLVTWQDKRCLEGGFLEALNTRTGKSLRSGFGCATLAWFSDFKKLPLESISASTIQDLVVAQLCGLSRPLTDPTNAASWGLFDLKASSWDKETASAIGIPVELLPKNVPDGHIAGHLLRERAEFFDIPAGIPVITAVGDNQASIFATLQEPEKELFLTIGTGAQLSAVLSNNMQQVTPKAYPTFEYRPYMDDRLLAVSAILSGGSAWRWLATVVQEWMSALCLAEIPLQRIYITMNELGLADSSEGLTISPSFLGERNNEELRGSIEGIGLDNFSLGSVARALATGICTTLRDLLPAELRSERIRIMGSGNGLALNPLIRAAAESVLGLPVVLNSMNEAAAIGAARNAVRVLQNRI